MPHQYSIQEVRDSDGRYWTSEEILEKSQNDINRLRNQCYRAHKLGEEPPFVCGYCHQPVWLPATTERIHHFKHFHFAGINKCVYYSGSIPSIAVLNARKYNGAKEGRKHREFKELILQSLSRNPVITDLKLEKVIKASDYLDGEDAREWRKPDINGIFNNIHFSIELQLSTTWLREIVGRTIFYRRLGFFLLWIFDKFYPEYTDRELAYSDVFCNNNENAFVFDRECHNLSKVKNDLILKCYYSKYVKDGFIIADSIQSEIITFSSLTFDHNKRMVYYYDSLGEKKRLEDEIEAEMDQLCKESDQRMAELIRNERNKEYDAEMQELQGKIDDKLNTISGLDDTIRQVNEKISEEANITIDETQVSSVISAWSEGKATPSEFARYIPQYVEATFTNGIKSLKETFALNQNNRSIFTKVFSLLSSASTRKVLGQDYIVPHADLIHFSLFNESIFFVRRIELETTIIKPTLQKLPQHLDAGFIDRKDIIFLMSRKDFDQNKRKLHARISAPQPTLNYSALVQDLTNHILTSKNEKTKAHQAVRRHHENQKQKIMQEVEELQKNLVPVLRLKTNFNSPEEVIF